VFILNHPKMQYTYVGIDSHKDTHTAVFLDCFFEKSGEITFNNLPSEFPEFLNAAEKLKMQNTILLFGLEDTSCYGRLLTLFLKENNALVKHVNALLVARERKNRNITEKSDSVDAECAARVLLSKFGELPDANPEDTYWILRSLVIRRKLLVKTNTCVKNQLHAYIFQHYPNYHSFFSSIDCDTSLAFFARYPSPGTLENTTADVLSELLREHSGGKIGASKADEILDGLQDTIVPFQEIRDDVVRSAIRHIRFNSIEIERLEANLSQYLEIFGVTLTSMAGIDIVTASYMLSCIGDIRRFPTADKLARYSGVAPVTYASGKKDLQFANQRGNRELNSILYQLAIRVSNKVPGTNKAMNPFFYEYYREKQKEGKTKRQALKCVQRRLVSIIWTMLTNHEEYVNPPMLDLPKGAEEDANGK